jgi:NAD(P)-dependent dehydrogenase (short-subunit alcohol dehydrogenase family)
MRLKIIKTGVDLKMGNISWNFKGKVAVITGAASGIGRGTAVEFAKAGAAVAVCDFDFAGAEETIKLIKYAGGNAKAYKMDVTSNEEIMAAKDAILKDFGTVDFLFSNAGISAKVMGPPFESIPDWDWENTFNVNVFGAAKVCRAFMPIMKEKKSGKIVITSSIAAYLSSPLTVVYSASKIAAINLAQALSVELGDYNINVNALCPGFVYTKIYSDGTGMRFREKRPALQQFNDNESVMNAMASGSALHRAQSPKDMANTVMFLCSEEASEITGQVFSVDSGIIRR